MRVPPQEFEVDSAILAVGISGMKKMVAGSKALQQPDFRRVNNLGSVDVLAGNHMYQDRLPVGCASHP